MNTAICFKFTTVLVFILNLSLLKVSDQGFCGAVRLDGTLSFVGVDETPRATIHVEIAETAEARRLGLMGRSSLHITEGMLFIFEEAQRRYFWMSNTPVSLDMIFVDPEKRIVHMVESALPLSEKMYDSRFPAQYVVEVPAGFVKLFNIKTGMRIRWQRR